MGKQIQFDYYYGIEAEQFSFYRVPRLLIKDERFKGLSSDAKLLYGLMLDRMSLSMKNGWLDEENRAYIIYTLDTVMEDLGCAKATCVKIMKELDSDNGIGLIEKKRRGLGKFYGCILANVIFNPIAKKLRIRQDEEELYCSTIIEGIIAIQAGENPKYLREHLLASIKQSQQQKILAKAGDGGSQGKEQEDK